MPPESFTPSSLCHPQSVFVMTWTLARSPVSSRSVIAVPGTGAPTGCCALPHPQEGPGVSCVILETWTLMSGLERRGPAFYPIFMSVLGEGLADSANPLGLVVLHTLTMSTCSHHCWGFCQMVGSRDTATCQGSCWQKWPPWVPATQSRTTSRGPDALGGEHLTS